MATIIINTVKGNEIYFQNANQIVDSFLKNHGVFMPWELENFGFTDCLETVTLFEAVEGKFNARYVIDRIVIDVDAVPVDSEMYYCLSTAVKFDPYKDSFSELKNYEKHIKFPAQKAVTTAGQVHAYIKDIEAQIPAN